MLKKGLALGFLVLFTLPCFAQEESITITTYYPSPYGSYNELRTNKMVIGDVDVASTPAPSQGAVTFKPVLQSEITDYSEGTLYYDSSAHNFKYRNDSSWQAMGVSGWERVSNTCTATGFCTVSCSSGKKLLGGGCDEESNYSLGASYPSNDTTWTCQMVAGIPVQSTLTAYAICATLE